EKTYSVFPKILIATPENKRAWNLVSPLKAKGWSVVTAYNGEQALQVVETGQPDIVIIDFRLPDMDGLDVVKYIRQTRLDSETGVFMVYPSQIALEARKPDTEENGLVIDAYLMVPLHPAEIITFIKRIFYKGISRKCVSHFAGLMKNPSRRRSANRPHG